MEGHQMHCQKDDSVIVIGHQNSQKGHSMAMMKTRKHLQKMMWRILQKHVEIIKEPYQMRPVALELTHQKWILMLTLKELSFQNLHLASSQLLQATFAPHSIPQFLSKYLSNQGSAY